MMFLENAGGLGNQLFIWSAAHQIAREKSGRVVILTPKKSNRKNELKELTLVCSHKIFVIETNLYFKMTRFLEKVERNLFPSKALSKFLGIITLHDPTSKLDSVNINARILRGYFQYPEIITINAEEVISEFRDLIQKNYEAISARFELPVKYQVFHIRRGDYLENQETLGVLTDKYFSSSRDKNLPLVICTENASELTDSLNALHIIDKHTASTWETLAVMAKSSTLVISNSTLSWWGGFLAIAERRSVDIICPEPWTKSKITSKDYLRIPNFIYRKAEFL